MKMNRILILLIATMFAGGVFAQGSPQGGSGIECKRNFDFSEMKTKQAEYFVKELNLTDAQSEKFTPLMQEYILKRFELNKALRDAGRNLKKIDKPSDADYLNVVNLSVETKVKEAALQKEYYAKFLKIMSPEQVCKYAQTEQRYARKTLEGRGKPGKNKKSDKKEGRGNKK